MRAGGERILACAVDAGAFDVSVGGLSHRDVVEGADDGVAGIHQSVGVEDGL
ncbi:hypothetical protein Rhow_004819 [Rhodococcus wratislaviensis]|uniref:Uncharacterized protein n=1 Tax=Rhodococcus wratislaviensis TaxID=44752 RepID=A0A402CBY4_RHOWR|nr:hypothetical protein Rhow_004819 [Rhodococcus wratislaviensis]